MRQLMPLRRAVVEVTHEARSGDDPGIRRAVKSWHNRLSNGSIPRYLVTRLGRQLFLDLSAWEDWLAKRVGPPAQSSPGRPRSP